MYQIMCQPGNGVLAEAFALCHFLSARRPVGTPRFAPPARRQVCKALMLDGVVLSRKTRAGALKIPALVVPGLRPDGRKEIVDHRLAKAGSVAEWERFLDNARGLTCEGPEMIRVDGGQGLLAALPTAYRGVPVQRCRARKIRNVLDKVRKAGSPSSRVCTLSLSTAPRHGAPPDVSPHAGEMPAPKPSPACATISR